LQLFTTIGLDDVQSSREWCFFQRLRFLDQSDDYEEGTDGISSFFSQNI